MDDITFKAYSYDNGERCERFGCHRPIQLQITEWDSNKERALICRFHADQDYIQKPDGFDGQLIRRS